MTAFALANNRILIVAGVLAAMAVALVFSALTSGLNANSAGLSILVCDSTPKAVSLTHASGFALIKSRSSTPALIQDTDLSIHPIGIYEFVLKPGSVGHVKMVFDFCPSVFEMQSSRTLNYSELNELFQSSNSTNQIIHKLNEKPPSNDAVLTEIPNAMDVGLRIDASDITKLNNHAVGVTYTISSEPSADKATYVITNFYGICPGELLTIGDRPNENSLEWVKGPFYGCGA